MSLNEIPKHIQAAGLYLGLPALKKMGISIETKDICKSLDVEHGSILKYARGLLKDVFSTGPSDAERKNLEWQQRFNEQCFLTAVYEYQASHPNCWSKVERHQMTDGFKALLIAKKDEYDLSWGDVSRLTKIPEDTLKKIKGQDDDKHDGGSGLTALSDQIVDKLSQYFKGRSGKATVKDFCEKNPDVLIEMGMSYRAFAGFLLRLGYVSPKGIFLKNTGLDLIKRFLPNIIWGSDGKNINLQINGINFRWVWQSLIDYKTTVLVGGLIAESETTDNLLEAISRSRETSGISPMAIVLDNRLSENLPAIREYLDKMGIEIIKTFPGNSKSNGIIENNFHIFENWVHGKGGKIVIDAKSDKDLSRSLAELLVELFTQMRNFGARKGFSGKSATDAAQNAAPLSKDQVSALREEIKALANRLKNELATPVMTLAKEEALKKAIDILSPPSPEIFRKRLSASHFTADLILQALAIFRSQQEKHPERKFDHTYFGGIIRNLADQEYLRSLNQNLQDLYSEYWKSMDQKIQTGVVQQPESATTCEALLREFLFAKIPAQGTLVLNYLKNFMFHLAGQNPGALASFRQSLTAKVLKEKLAPLEKRETLSRKLYEIESHIRLVAKIPAELIKNATQAFSQSLDTAVRT